jgi:cyanophycinase
MSGLMALLGSGAYLDTMNDVDQWLLAHSTVYKPRVVCVPTAAVPFGQRKLEHYARLGLEHFRKLGVQVEIAGIDNRFAAYNPRWLELIRAADVIYFSGGNPLHLCQTLGGTPAWQAVLERWCSGATLAGSSAGAIMLAQPFALPAINLQIIPALGLLPDYCVWPHFDLRLVKHGFTRLKNLLLGIDARALAIDENTALVGHIGEKWQVMGAGSVSLITSQQSIRYASSSGLILTMPEPRPALQLTESPSMITASPQV